MLIDIIGWIALIIILPSAFFQVIKNFRRKSTEGVSLPMTLSVFVGLSLFLVVSLARPTPIPTLAQFAVGSVVWGTILLQMAVYRKKV